METQKRDKRKVLLLLPLLVTPFLAVGFYAMGGGKGNEQVTIAKGINASLPEAKFKKQDPVDKMGFYALGKDTLDSGDKARLTGQLAFERSAGLDKTAKIEAKLAELNKEINSPSGAASSDKASAFTQAPKKFDDGSSMKADIDRLEMLMNSMKADKAADPEMEQMNGMLEKILEIQNPSRAQAKIDSKTYGSGERSAFQAVPAEIASGMKAVQGSTVKLRLLDSVVFKNVVIPSGHFVFGLCRIVNQRLLLDIKHIRLGEQIIPVDLTVYGLDGLLGISAPDAVVREVASLGAVDAVSGISVYGMDGVAGQVTGAGINAAKSLFSRKVKVVRVKLRAGEKVLLRVNKGN